MKFNPHLHVIVAEGIVDKNNNYKNYDYFPYEKIRKSFTYELVNSLKKVISPKLKEFSICVLIKIFSFRSIYYFNN